MESPLILLVNQKLMDVWQNLEYARGLLVKLEQDALHIKVQSRKQQTQLDLVAKRNQILLLEERLQEFNEVGTVVTLIGKI